MIAHRVRSRAPRPCSPAADLKLLPGLVVIGAVTFNALLAIVNAHVTALSSAHVIAAEVSLVGAAHVLALANYKPRMTPWYALTVILLLFAVYRSAALGQIEVKYLRDVLLIPTFVVLGMTFDDRRLTRIVLIVHAIVLAVMVLEALNTSAYANLFGIQDYYINTRGYTAESFWNKESELYVSAVRPDSRMFEFIDLHRLSSVFLEPVSLGNYCVVIVSFVCARYRQLGAAARWFLIVGTVLALIGCDGRLATVASLLIIAVSLVVQWLPRYSAVLYLPAVTLGVVLLVQLAGYHGGADDFPGRLAYTVELLGQYGMPEFLGASDTFIEKAVDSGIGYLITTQSIFGLAILWMFIVFGSYEETRAQLRFTHATCLYLSLTLMVSFAFLSIKTAALLWFIHGALQVRRRPAEAAHRALPEQPYGRTMTGFAWPQPQRAV